MKSVPTLAATVTCLALAFTLAACEQEGPAEQAGARNDEAYEKAGDTVEEVGDKIEEAADQAN